MTAVISMLRGVNVGGHNKVKMETLRELYEVLGMKEPRSYVQSGNVVFKTAEKDLKRVVKTLEDGIDGKFGFRVSVITRTAAEMREVIARNPFAGRPEVEAGKLIVAFLGSTLDTEARAKILAIKADPEEVRVHERELYIHFPNGMGKTKLPMASIEKTSKTAMTSRNWNSVLKLMEMAQALT